MESSSDSQDDHETTAQGKYSIVRQGGALTRIRRDAGTFIFGYGKFVDIVEKFVKILTWEDQNVSDKFMIGLIIAFIIVTFIPIRTIISLVVVKKFLAWGTRCKRRYISNYESCKIEIRNMFYRSKVYTAYQLEE